MKEKILNVLISSNETLNNMSSAQNRVIGEKTDVVTSGDIEIGSYIVDSFLQDTQNKIIIESEEHGKKQNFTDGQEDYYIAIDDIDGTNNLRVGNGILPYCSMIVAFKKKTDSDTYTFSDYSHAACIDHINKRIFYTEKGLGFVEQYNLNREKISDTSDNIQDNSNLALTLSTDVVSTMRGGDVGYSQTDTKDNIPVIPSILEGVYKKYAIVDSGCSVFEYAMLGSKIRNGYVSDGKKMHELPLLFAFCKETNQKMLDFNGQPYDSREYNFKGKGCSVVAGEERTVNEVIELITKQKLVNDKILKLLSSLKDISKDDNTER